MIDRSDISRGQDYMPSWRVAMTDGASVVIRAPDAEDAQRQIETLMDLNAEVREVRLHIPVAAEDPADVPWGRLAQDES